eukprot:scaffold4073_cov61-Phaeocystis_antarctica.AAC.5
MTTRCAAATAVQQCGAGAGGAHAVPIVAQRQGRAAEASPAEILEPRLGDEAQIKAFRVAKGGGARRRIHAGRRE